MTANTCGRVYPNVPGHAMRYNANANASPMRRLWKLPIYVRIS
jgi:hypothetical protein